MRNLIKILFLSTLLITQTYSADQMNTDVDEEGHMYSLSQLSPRAEINPPAYTDIVFDTSNPLPAYSNRPMTAERAVWYLFPKSSKVTPQMGCDYLEELDHVESSQIRGLVENIKVLAENDFHYKKIILFIRSVREIVPETERNSIISACMKYLYKEIPNDHISRIVDCVRLIPFHQRAFTTLHSDLFFDRHIDIDNLTRMLPALSHLNLEEDSVEVFSTYYRGLCNHTDINPCRLFLDELSSIPSSKRSLFQLAVESLIIKNVKSVLCPSDFQSQIEKIHNFIYHLPSIELEGFKANCLKIKSRNYKLDTLRGYYDLLENSTNQVLAITFLSLLDVLSDFMSEKSVKKMFYVLSVKPIENSCHSLFEWLRRLDTRLSPKEKEKRLLDFLDEQETQF